MLCGRPRTHVGPDFGDDLQRCLQADALSDLAQVSAAGDELMQGAAEVERGRVLGNPLCGAQQAMGQKVAICCAAGVVSKASISVSHSASCWSRNS